jgi:hypothetical protein
VAAEHLLAQHTAFQAVVGEECLGHRRQQGHLALGTLALAGILGVAGDVQLLADVHGEGAAAFGEGAHGQQHAPHIAVHDDRVGAARGGVAAAGARLCRRSLA